MSWDKGELYSAQPGQQYTVALDSGELSWLGRGPLRPLSNPLSLPDCELREDRDFVLPTLDPQTQPRTWPPLGQMPAAIY